MCFSTSPKLLRKTEEDEGLSGFMREGMLTPKHDTGAGRRGEGVESGWESNNNSNIFAAAVPPITVCNQGAFLACAHIHAYIVKMRKKPQAEKIR